MGDCKLFAKFPDGKLEELTQDIDRPALPFNSESKSQLVSDPGGQLGRTHVKRTAKDDELLYGEVPDLRNLSVVYFKLPKGTVLLPMTDGVYDNFDPQLLKLTPQQTLNALSPDYQIQFQGKTIEKDWSKSEVLSELKQAYLLDQLKKAIEGKQGQEAVDNIVHAAMQNVVNGPEVKGKVDDTTCSWIQTG